jgi:hypothetical protein
VHEGIKGSFPESGKGCCKRVDAFTRNLEASGDGKEMREVFEGDSERDGEARSGPEKIGQNLLSEV